MPYARVGIHKFKQGTIDEVIKKGKTKLLPVDREQPGFIAYEVIKIDDETAISISTWKTKKQAENALKRVSEWREQASIPAAVKSIDDSIGAIAFSYRSE